MTEFVKVATVDDIPAGSGKCVECGGKELAVFNIDGSFHAIDNACTHQGGPLAEGTVDGHTVICPWHGGPFDVTTGEALRPPPRKNVATYRVRVNGPDIEIEV